MKRHMITLLLGIVLMSGLGLGLTEIEHNETLTFEYLSVNVSDLVAANVSYAETMEEFFCAPDRPESEVCTASTLSLSLQPGETRNVNQGLCQGVAHCVETGSDPPQECVIDRTMDPGDHLEIKDGVCNVEIEVRDENSTGPVCETYQHTENFRVQTTTDGNIRLEIQNRTFTVPINNLELFSYEGEVILQCPKEIEFDSVAEEDDLLSVCQEYTPFLVNDWIRPTLEACRNQASEIQDDTETCSAEKAGLRDTIAQCQADISAQKALTSACSEVVGECQNERNANQSKVTNLTVWLVFLGIYAGLATVMLGVLGVYIWKKGGAF